MRPLLICLTILACAADAPLAVTHVRPHDAGIAPLRRQGQAWYIADNQLYLRGNARTISNDECKTPAVGVPTNDRGLTNAVWAWGQFIDHDMDLTESDPSNGIANIAIHDDEDPFYPNPILFNRSHFVVDGDGLRQQLNEITPYIDASNVYGSDPTTAASLREFAGGRMILIHRLLPQDAAGFFLAGDIRSNENIVLTSFHTLFVREHNRIVGELAKYDPSATDETLYQLARKIVAAELQVITYEDWLPALMGPYAPRLSDHEYDSTLDPQIANEFATVGFRFGHSMLTADILAGEQIFSLREAFFAPEKVTDENVGLILQGLHQVQANEVDRFLVEDVRSFLFGAPGAGGADLAALNMQRGRDHGVGDYDDVRLAYGLERSKWIPGIGLVGQNDPWIEMLKERHLPASSLGETATAILREQFLRTMNADPLFHLMDPDLQQKGVKKAVNLRTVRLSQIIRWNTGLPTPNDVFQR